MPITPRRGPSPVLKAACRARSKGPHHPSEARPAGQPPARRPRRPSLSPGASRRSPSVPRRLVTVATPPSCLGGEGGGQTGSASGSRRLRLPVRKHGGASQWARRRRRRRSGIVAAAFLRAEEFPAAAPELAGPPSGEKGDDRRSLASPTPSFGLVDGRPRGNPKGIVVGGGFAQAGKPPFESGRLFWRAGKLGGTCPALSSFRSSKQLYGWETTQRSPKGWAKVENSV